MRDVELRCGVDEPHLLERHRPRVLHGHFPWSSSCSSGSSCCSVYVDSTLVLSGWTHKGRLVIDVSALCMCLARPLSNTRVQDEVCWHFSILLQVPKSSSKS